MAVFNLGSINIDHFYHVRNFVDPGETIASRNYFQSLGGKGANQSVALSRAGGNVRHIGAINLSDIWIVNELTQDGVNTEGVAFSERATGHAIIQVNERSENCIILFDGANSNVSGQAVKRELSKARADDWLLIQNETNLQVEAAELAHKLGLKVAYNPAPMDVDLARKVARHADLLVVNEPEVKALMHTTDMDVALDRLQSQFAGCQVVVTLGKAGSWYYLNGYHMHVPSFDVRSIDTTAAGDTYIGYLLANIDQTRSIEQAMKEATAAAALCVMRVGTSKSIPYAKEVKEFLQEKL